jgi:ABC-type phosphate/phosphonate transport system substrate-binding protein
VPSDAPSGHCPSCLLDLGFGPLPEDSTPPIARSTRVGEYELLEQIGRGGMGVVYKARQMTLNRLVALKMLSTVAAASPGVAERLRLEAEAAGGLRHPGIVTIYDVDEHEGQPFLTMELIEGSSLDRCIGPDGFRSPPGSQGLGGRTKPEADVVRLMIQIVRAVDYAHKHGVLHRDLKPANILVDQNGEPHLTDFGLAKVLGRVATSGTATGVIMGTPAYMAPEQATGATKHASIAADIYSLGAVLYDMLTGRPPFRAETPLETLRQVVEDAPKSPSTFNRQVDRDLGTICLKCLEKDPEHRYASALALAEDLERWSRGEPIEARPMRDLKRLWCWCRREPALASLLGGVFLLLTTVAVLGFHLQQQGKTRLELAAQMKGKQLEALLDRIEAQWHKERSELVKITPQELEVLTDHPLPHDPSEVRVTLGVRTRLRKPDKAVYQMAPLAMYLQTNLMTVPPLCFELNIYTDRDRAYRDLLDGEVDLMRADPADYVLARARDTNLVPLVRERYSGQPELRGALFVREDSGIERLEDLKGRSFALNEPDSALGDYLPKAELVKAGLRAVDLGRLTNFSSAAAVTAVRLGSLDAGVANWEDLGNARKLGAQLKILKELSCPEYPWVATKKLSRKMAKTIGPHLKSLHTIQVPMRFEPWLTGFEPVLPSDYDRLAREIEIAGGFGLTP